MTSISSNETKNSRIPRAFPQQFRLQQKARASPDRMPSIVASSADIHDNNSKVNSVSKSNHSKGVPCKYGILASGEAARKMTLLPADFAPGDGDVLMGRGRTCYNHTGSVRFRNMCVDRLDEYSRAEGKAEKSCIIAEIVRRVREYSQKGGFVKMDTESGNWYEVGDYLARERTSQVFRDVLHDQYKSSNPSKNKKRKLERDCARLDKEGNNGSSDGSNESKNKNTDQQSKKQKVIAGFKHRKKQIKDQAEQQDQVMRADQHQQYQQVLELRQQHQQQHLVAGSGIRNLGEPHHIQQPCVRKLSSAYLLPGGPRSMLRAQTRATSSLGAIADISTADPFSRTMNPPYTVVDTMTGSGGSISSALAVASQRLGLPSSPRPSTVLAGKRDLTGVPYDPGMLEAATTVAGIAAAPPTRTTQQQRAFSLDTGFRSISVNNNKTVTNKSKHSSTALSQKTSSPSPVSSLSLPPAKRAKTNGNTNNGGSAKPVSGNQNISNLIAAIGLSQQSIEEKQEAMEKSMQAISHFLRAVDEKLDSVLDALKK